LRIHPPSTCDGSVSAQVTGHGADDIEMTSGASCVSRSRWASCPGTRFEVVDEHDYGEPSPRGADS